MATLSSNYRDGKGRNAERHERIRKAELAAKAERDAARAADKPVSLELSDYADEPTSAATFTELADLDI